MAPAALGTGKDYPFLLPINIVETESRDLSGANTVHREHHEDRVISNHRWLISRRGIENFLHDVPTRAGWQCLLLENTRGHNRGGDARATPAAHFGISEK